MDLEEVTPASDQLQCAQCAKVFSHTGRGRKPTKCPQCRAKATSLNPGGVKKPPANAKAAAEAMDSYYAILVLALKTFGADGASHILNEQRESAKIKNEEFLAKDPKLCAALTQFSTVSGRAGFVASNLMMVAPVATMAYMELSVKYGFAGKN